MAGAAGFEPTDGGIKTRCLTTWRRPKFDAVLRWQGRLDSNQRMAGSKPAALPLGDALIQSSLQVENGRGGWIRTNGWRDQNPLPYHLATPLTCNFKMT